MPKLIALACLITLAGASSAHAHFKLLSPDSWLKEDSAGGPQKGSPCGPGNTGLLGDDVTPIPTSGAITEVHAGDTITVKLQETVYHPGYFRIALAEKRDDFTIPPVDDPSSCAFDLEKVPTGAHDNVLADGLFKVEAASGSNRMLMQDVKLPDKACDKCTLQVVQVMLNHGLNSCYYYHCADLKILPAGSSPAAGSGGAESAAGMGSSAGAGASAGSSTAGSIATPSGMAGTTATSIAGRSSTATPPPAIAGMTAASAGAPAPVPPTVMMTPPASSTKSSGCALVPARDGSDLVGGSWLLAGVFVLSSRRRR